MLPPVRNPINICLLRGFSFQNLTHTHVLKSKSPYKVRIQPYQHSQSASNSPKPKLETENVVSSELNTIYKLHARIITTNESKDQKKKPKNRHSPKNLNFLSVFSFDFTNSALNSGLGCEFSPELRAISGQTPLPPKALNQR